MTVRYDNEDAPEPTWLGVAAWVLTVVGSSVLGSPFITVLAVLALPGAFVAALTFYFQLPRDGHVSSERNLMAAALFAAALLLWLWACVGFGLGVGMLGGRRGGSWPSPLLWGAAALAAGIVMAAAVWLRTRWDPPRVVVVAVASSLALAGILLMSSCVPHGA